MDAAESRKGRRGECARHEEDETRHHAKARLGVELKLKRAPLQVHSWAVVFGWAWA